MDYYFLFDNTANEQALYDSIEECRTRHLISAPGTMLSVRVSYSGHEKCVKVCGADESWLNSRQWPDGIIIFEYPKGHLIGDQVRERWSAAQCLTFDSNNDGAVDTDTERKAYWYDYWQSLLG